jgi:7-keto-8-aminopelargonate synthetase-like enzyme/acyl-CoA synthetase (AMP-forming)/AMP-acid ligase II/ribosomal protein S18 acetylase RimI-like enzyme/acyl carrier protein
MSHDFTSILQRFLSYVEEAPGQVAFHYIHADGIVEQITRGDLLRRSAAVGNYLRAHAQPQDRICIALPHGPQFLYAFLGTLYARMIAVPCNLPRSRRNQSLARLQALIEDATPRLVLGTEASGPLLATEGRESNSDPAVAARDLRQVPVESLFAEPDHEWRESPTDAEAGEVAYLQYTSGSTGRPKGVMVTHGNLIANERAIQSALGHSPETVMVSWLPFFHDMGLICGLLQPIFVGFPGVLLSPQMFMNDPFGWLKACSDFRATTTGAPNFAYDLCVERITDEQVAQLDLRSLQVAYNGSEPVRHETQARFAARFAPVGFRSEAFLPCYGLAEATLIVSGGPWHAPVASIRLDVSGTQVDTREEQDEATGGKRSPRVVSCGQIAPETVVVVVDPASQTPVANGHTGELWVRGSSVTAGYWNNADETERVFGARLADDTGHRFLRTGDLGLVHAGEVYITGRLKDLLIVRGRNIYPQDLETHLLATLDLKGVNRCAAVGLERDRREGVGIVLEANAEMRNLVRSSDREGSPELDAIARQIHQQILDEFDVAIDGIAFMRPGRLPRTTSGKLQRSACRAAFDPHNDDLLYLTHPEQYLATPVSAVLARIRELLRKHQELAPDEAAEDADNRVSLSQLGMDSLSRTAFLGELENEYSIASSEALNSNDPTLHEIVQWIRRTAPSRSQTETPASVPSAAPAAASTHPGHDSVPAPHLQVSQAASVAQAPAARSRSLDTGDDRVLRVDSKVTSMSDFEQREARDLFAKTRDFSPWLEDYELRGFKRYLLPVIEQRGGRALVGGDRYAEQREVILFASADYLGLSHDPRVKLAAARSIMEHGCNVGSVPLIAGSTPVHSRLERELAEWLGTESCVLFPTGQSANMATIAALCSQKDTVVVDNQVHYSILEGVRLAHARWRTFLHNNPDSLREVLESVRQSNPDRGVLVIVEGVYGIAGDVSNLPELLAVAHTYDARVMIDDAHGIGVLGHAAGGAAQLQGVSSQVDILMGSLSKALGSFGGFVAARKDVVDYLRFFAKSIAFAVGMPTVNAAASLEALSIIREEPQRVRELLTKSAHFRQALVDMGFTEAGQSESTIMSLVVGDEKRLRDLTRLLFEQGVWVEGLPFPAVPRGQERIRFRVRVQHTFQDLEEAAQAVRRIVRPLRRRSASTFGTPSLADSCDNWRWQTRQSLTVAESRMVAQLAIDVSHERGSALPWVSREFIEKYYRRDEYWRNLPAEPEWHLLFADEDLLAAFCVDRTQVTIDGSQEAVELLGTLTYCQVASNHVRARIEEVTAARRDRVQTLIAPANHPVFVFGAGSHDWQPATAKPLLESSLAASEDRLFDEAHWAPSGEKRYWQVRLDQHAGQHGHAVTRGDRSRTTLREFRRHDPVKEVEWMAPLIQQTLGQLELCAPLNEQVILGLIQDLRELIMPGFWLVAEREERPIAFVLAYPNITQEFLRVAGAADIADFQLMQQAMEHAPEAFVAWLAVDPDHANQGVAEHLLEELMRRLRARKYTHAWLSWELVDGATPQQQLLDVCGVVEQSVSMPVLARLPSRSASPSSVPAPHVTAAKAEETAPSDWAM